MLDSTARMQPIRNQTVTQQTVCRCIVLILYAAIRHKTEDKESDLCSSNNHSFHIITSRMTATDALSMETFEKSSLCSTQQLFLSQPIDLTFLCTKLKKGTNSIHQWW